MAIPWEAVGAIGTILGAAVPLYALRNEIKRSRFSQAVELLLKFEADFFGTEKRQQRSEAAAGITEGDFSEVEDILDFFETIALLTKKGALDQYMVWHTFYYWINRYYQLACKHIEETQAEDETVWQDLVPFIGDLRKLEFKQRKLKTILETIPSEEDLKEFLGEEMAESPELQ